jgi:hypothetical protein
MHTYSSVQVLRRFGLKDNYYQSGWGEKYRVGTNLKWTPDQVDKQALPDPMELRQRMLERIKERSIKKFKVGSKVLTTRAKKALERSQQVIKNRVLALNEGWEKKKLDHASESGHKFEMRRDESKDYWSKRVKAAKEYMPEELNEPAFELQRLAAAAQRGELDEAGLEAYRKLREQKRVEQREAQREKREKLRQAVLSKYGTRHLGTHMDT